MIKWLICIFWGHSYRWALITGSRCTRCFKKHEEKPKKVERLFGLEDGECPHNDSYDDCPDCRH